ncbi:hypothetical protein ACVGWB_03245, partial [Enterobacter mori]
VTFVSGCKYLFAWLSIRESSERRKRKMLDFTWYVMFFNYCLTKMPGGGGGFPPTPGAFFSPHTNPPHNKKKKKPPQKNFKNIYNIK